MSGTEDFVRTEKEDEYFNKLTNSVHEQISSRNRVLMNSGSKNEQLTVMRIPRTIDQEPILCSNTRDKIEAVYTSQMKLVLEKNKRYGNAALAPVDIFSKHIKNENTVALNSILIRLSDKLARIKNADELRKNDVSDLMGYLSLLCVEKEWLDFDDLID